MKIRLIGVLAALSLAAISLSACAEQIDTATPTPVDFKACMISNTASFSDGGASQSSYFGLQQAQAQFGPAISVVQLKSDSDASRTLWGAKLLVSRGCNLIFAVQDNYSALATLANGNPKVRFVEIDPSASGGMIQPTPNQNLNHLIFDSRAAYLEAGYLAAAKSMTGKVAIIGAAGKAAYWSAIWYFRQGIHQFNEATGKSVQIVNAQQADLPSWTLLPANSLAPAVKRATRQALSHGADVLFPMGVNGLAVAQVALENHALVIGSDSDWAAQDRYATVKSAILASVTKPLAQAVVDQVAQAMGLATATPDPTVTRTDVTNFTATLTDEAGVSYEGTGEALKRLAESYLAGKLDVVEAPAVY
jgi:basic membrane protein A and related proteins